MNKRREQRREQRVKDLMKVLSDFENLELRSIHLQQIGRHIRRLLTLPSKAALPLQKTLLPYIGKNLSHEELRRLAQKLTYGRNALIRGRPVGKQFLMRRDVSEAYCEQIQMVKPRGNKWEFPPLLHFYVREGVLATETLIKRGTPRFVGWLGCKVGLRTRKYSEFHPRELFHLGVKLVMKVKEGEPVIGEIFVTDSLKRKNQQLTRARRGAECDIPCWACPKGKDECGLATHSDLWTVRKCSREGITGYFNEEGCVSCQDRIYKQNAGILTFGEQD